MLDPAIFQGLYYRWVDEERQDFHIFLAQKYKEATEEDIEKAKRFESKYQMLSEVYPIHHKNSLKRYVNKLVKDKKVVVLNGAIGEARDSRETYNIEGVKVEMVYTFSMEEIIEEIMDTGEFDLHGHPGYHTIKDREGYHVTHMIQMFIRKGNKK
jgi:ppGpp synthetase/RelA/SpoT-type nucleotidyltranferase